MEVHPTIRVEAAALADNGEGLKTGGGFTRFFLEIYHCHTGRNVSYCSNLLSAVRPDVPGCLALTTGKEHRISTGCTATGPNNLPPRVVARGGRVRLSVRWVVAQPFDVLEQSHAPEF